MKPFLAGHASVTYLWWNKARPGRSQALMRVVGRAVYSEEEVGKEERHNSLKGVGLQWR